MIKLMRPNIAKDAVYPPEFREEAVPCWLSSGQTLAAEYAEAGSADLGLSPACLRSWRKQMEGATTATTQTQDSVVRLDATPATNERPFAREIGELLRELAAMTRQRFRKRAICL